VLPEDTLVFGEIGFTVITTLLTEGMALYLSAVDDAARMGTVFSRTARALAPKAAGTFGKLAHVEKYGVQSYRQIRKAIKGTGLEAHHLLEKRFAGVLGVKPGDMASAALTKAEHQAFTNAWRKAIPYGSGTANATREQVLGAAKQIYKDHPGFLKALGQ
jgi:hypothetical protein